MNRKKWAVAAMIGGIAGVLAIQLIWPSRDIAQEPNPANAQPVGLQGTNEPLHIQAVTAVEAGRYLVKISGCNDCHTAEWMESSGTLPEERWLTGVPVGYKGPWGTSYASNLRLYIKDFTPDLWVQVVRARTTRPPMPWTSLHAMSDGDLRSIYAYIKYLGPGGEPTPAAVPPNQEPKTPFFVFVPQMPAGAPSTPDPEPAEQSGPRR